MQIRSLCARSRSPSIRLLVYVRRVSAHARLLTRFFLSDIISKFFTHAASRYAPIDLYCQPENSPPFDGMRCNLRSLTEAVPLPNLHGSKVQLVNKLGLLVQIPAATTLKVSILFCSPAHRSSNVQYACNGDRLTCLASRKERAVR